MTGRQATEPDTAQTLEAQAWPVGLSANSYRLPTSQEVFVKTI